MFVSHIPGGNISCADVGSVFFCIANCATITSTVLDAGVVNAMLACVEIKSGVKFNKLTSVF